MQFFKPAFIFLIPSIPLIFLGYGSDNDTYGVLSAGVSTWDNLIPQMSRHPGYWLYEVIVYGLSKLGGYILVNGATLVVSVLVLYRFYRLAICENVSNPTLLTLCLGFNPWFLIAATSTMDYMWALLFIVLSIELATKDKYFIAGVFSGVAVGLRLGSVFPLAFAFFFTWLKAGIKNSFKGYFLLGLVALVFIILFYFPSWLLSDKSFSFLTGHLGEESLWTLKMHAGRFFYKTIYLFGLSSFIVIVAIIGFHTLKGKGQISKSRLGIAAAGASIGNFILFAKYPIEISYLLPFLFFSLLLLGIYLGSESRNYLIAILVTTVSYSFINLSIAKPNIPGSASDASFGFFMEHGVLMQDISARLKIIDCSNMRCWEDKR